MDFFDKRFKTILSQRLKKNLFRVGRMFLVLVILAQFVYFGVTPTESMCPTIQVGDLIVFSKDISHLQRGDIINFTPPQDSSSVYLKRIIGLPGEMVEVKNGLVYINGSPLDENYIMEAPVYTVERVAVPKDCYFMLGDNRNNSIDSSSWGFLKKESIKGKVLMILLPLKHYQTFW